MHPLMQPQKGLFVQQRFEVLEVLTSCEVPNRFLVYPLDATGRSPASPYNSMYVKERTEGVCDFLHKWCCGPLREFTSDVYASAAADPRAVIASIHKSCGLSNCICCRSTTTVHLADGSNFAFAINDDMHPCDLCAVCRGVHISALNISIDGGCMCCANCCFDYPMQVTTASHAAAGEEKTTSSLMGNTEQQQTSSWSSQLVKLSGGCSEFCTGTNKYAVHFPPHASDFERLALLAAALHIDSNYFERQKGNSGGGGA